uniref:DNA endonuclease I-CpaI n=1 Tax=Lobochlamys segnis TaxID=52035 RepID=Q39562_9CHLO|nr:DNA endonuclease I-CpaI [Lobochlamys segnis]AAL34374.1 unknown [Lobochlamys segnis]ALO21041.1 putative LAGLIDADG homing endonuclease [Lobochlamys segnis]
MDINPQWITGFVDGEGCFSVSILRNNSLRYGHQLQPEFVVTQHKLDANVLYALKDYFKVGSVVVNHGERLCYKVKNIDHFITVIIPFFEKHELKTKRRIEFLRFRKICLLLKAGRHLESQEGFEKVLDLAKKLRINEKNYQESIKRFEETGE